MQPLTLKELALFVDGRVDGSGGDVAWARVGVDSRRETPGGVFFALPGRRDDGARFVEDAFRRGYVAAVVAADFPGGDGLPLVRVADPLAALQRLAAYWRGRSPARWVGVTGSAGKTLAKDALAAALAPAWRVAASPGSFNSQLGVALSTLSVGLDADFAVLEAGVAAPGEMAPLAAMIRPDCGVFTGLGGAHRSAFADRGAHFAEKLRLFRDLPPDTGWLLLPPDTADDDRVRIRDLCPAPVHRCGDDDPEGVWPSARLRTVADGSGVFAIELRFPDRPAADRVVPLRTRSTRLASLAALALVAAGRLDRSLFPLRGLDAYTPGPTRMETWRSPHGVTLAADACGDDRLSVAHACRTLAALRRPEGRCALVLGVRTTPAASELFEAPFAHGIAPVTEDEAVELARETGVDRLVVVRPPAAAGADRTKKTRASGRRSVKRDKVLAASTPATTVCASPVEAAEALRPWLRDGDAVLFRGRRADGLGEAAELLLERPAANRLFVDLRAVAENAARFRRRAGGGVRLLGMIKALAYGTHLVELGRELARLGFDWLGVSTPDEGMLLRRAGVEQPLLAMLCPPEEADKAVRHRLTVALYSDELADALAAAVRRAGGGVDVHLKIDSGMGRLGVRPEDAVALARRATGQGLRVTGVLTHFARADESDADASTREQIRAFVAATQALRDAGFVNLLRHASATAGAARFPEAAYDMIRIGLGLYGLPPSAAVADACPPLPALALTSRLVVTGPRRAGERIGYGGTFVVPADGFRVGLIPMGYHDGLPWSVSGRGAAVGIRGRRAPLVGRVSMDSAVVDLSAIPEAAVGDDVLIWGVRDGLAIDPVEWAQRAGTTAYELLARLGPRVQRVFMGD